MSLNSATRFEIIYSTASVGAILSIILLYTIPWVVAYYHSEYLMYVNAWDEETYLTYQAGYGLLEVLGYKIDGAVIILFQEIGLSGAQINIIFDLIITPLTLLMFALAIKKYNIPFLLSLILSTILLFSSVLFNESNPLVVYLNSATNDFIFAGKEVYQSALRTPQPQLSLFILSIFILSYSKEV